MFSTLVKLKFSTKSSDGKAVADSRNWNKRWCL